MKECPLCEGKGKLPDRQVHFGDGTYEPETCTICSGTGTVEIKPEKISGITIIKPHGEWGERGAI